MTKQFKTSKKTALRSCVACRKTAAKQRLVRIVRCPDGSLRCDPSGRSPGRGAYLCPDQQCFDLAQRKRRLDSALKSPVSAADYERLRTEFSAAAAARQGATLPAVANGQQPPQSVAGRVPTAASKYGAEKLR